MEGLRADGPLPGKRMVQSNGYVKNDSDHSGQQGGHEGLGLHIRGTKEKTGKENGNKGPNNHHVQQQFRDFGVTIQ